MRVFNRTLTFCIILVFCLMSAGVATDKPELDELMARQRSLRSRAEAYISAQKSGNLKELYDLFSPQFRSEMTFDEFKFFPVGTSIGLMAVFIEAIEIEGVLGTVYMADMAFTSGQPSPKLTRRKTQSWIWEEGEWYVNPASVHGDYAPVVCGNVISPAKKMPDFENLPTFPPCGSSKQSKPPTPKSDVTPRKGCGR